MSVTFLEAIKLFYNRYVDFYGRSSRSEYWYAFLYFLLVSFILYSSDFLELLFGLANIIPIIAVSIRRMHDVGKSGWWVLIYFLPIVGWIIFFIFAALPTVPSSNDRD